MQHYQCGLRQQHPRLIVPHVGPNAGLFKSGFSILPDHGSPPEVLGVQRGDEQLDHDVRDEGEVDHIDNNMMGDASTVDKIRNFMEGRSDGKQEKDKNDEKSKRRKKAAAFLPCLNCNPFLFVTLITAILAAVGLTIGLTIGLSTLSSINLTK